MRGLPKGSNSRVGAARDCEKEMLFKNIVYILIHGGEVCKVWNSVVGKVKI